MGSIWSFLLFNYSLIENTTEISTNLTFSLGVILLITGLVSTTLIASIRIG